MTDPFDANKKVEFKFVNATSDTQFRFISIRKNGVLNVDSYLYLGHGQCIEKIGLITETKSKCKKSACQKKQMQKKANVLKANAKKQMQKKQMQKSKCKKQMQKSKCKSANAKMQML